MSTKRFFGWVAVLSILALPMYASAEMKGHVEASGMKAQGAMPNSHHIAFRLTDAAKKPVTEGKGTVTVTGPDKKETRGGVMGMQGGLGAAVNLAQPGEHQY